MVGCWEVCWVMAVAKSGVRGVSRVYIGDVVGVVP